MNGTYTSSNAKRIELEDVNSLTVEDMGFDRDAVERQMFGIHTIDPETKMVLQDEYFEECIDSALEEFEQMLDIRIMPHLVTEERDSDPAQTQNSFHLRLHQRPVLQVESVEAQPLQGRPGYEFPQEGYQVDTLAGHLYIKGQYLQQVIGQNVSYNTLGFGGTGGGSLGYGMSPYAGNHFNPTTSLVGVNGYGAPTRTPFAFKVNYVAGMLPPARRGVREDFEMPANLKQAILKQAAIGVFEQWGRLILGAGIDSKTVSMDGIMEAIKSTQSAMYGGAYADIRQFQDDLENTKKALKSLYGMRYAIM